MRDFERAPGCRFNSKRLIPGEEVFEKRRIHCRFMVMSVEHAVSMAARTPQA